MWVEGGSSGIGLDFVGHGVALNRAVGFVGFAALVGVAGWHVVWGWARWLGFAPDQVGGGAGETRLKGKRRWWVINGVSLGVVIAWAAGGIGIVARGGKVGGWVGRNYDAMYRELPIVKDWI